MKILRLFKLIVLILPTVIFSQNIKEENEIIKQMCLEFKNTENLSDSIRVENTYVKYLYPYLRKIDDAEIDSVGNSLYFRFQRECEVFRRFLDRVDPQDNWQDLKEMPASNLSKRELEEFKKIKNYYYLEGDNKITHVVVENNEWKDLFPDQTYSKNKFRWINNNEFELEFIESTNKGRKGFSRKGDKYLYKIINKKDNYFEIGAKIPNQNQILLFKLFIK